MAFPVISPYDWVFSPDFGSGFIGKGGIGRLLRETEIFTGALPFKVPHHELPDPPEPLKVQYVEAAINNSPAFAALFESGAFTDDEFVALLATA